MANSSQRLSNDPQYRRESQRRVERWLVKLDQFRNRLIAVFDKPIYHYIAFAVFTFILVLTVGSGLSWRMVQPNSWKLGEIAPYDLVASHDFEVESTQDYSQERLRLQTEAASAVLPVFDWHTERGDQLRLKTEIAFAAAREELAEDIVKHQKNAGTWQAPQVPENPSKESEKSDDTGFKYETASKMPAAQILQVIEDTPPEERLLRAREGAINEFERVINTELPARTTRFLATQGFNTQLELSLLQILSIAIDKAIVSNQSRRHAQEDQGIYLRRFRDGELLVSYRVLPGSDDFIGIDQVRSFIYRKYDTDQVVQNLNEEEFRTLATIAQYIITPNTTFNSEATSIRRTIARESIPPTVDLAQFRRGQVIVEKGNVIDERTLNVIEAMMSSESGTTAVQLFLGLSLLIVILITTVYSFGKWNLTRFKKDKRDIILMSLLLLATALLARATVILSAALTNPALAIHEAYWYWLIPAAAGTMIVRLVLSTETSILFALVSASLVAIICHDSLFLFFYVLIGSFVGAGTVFHVRNRIMIMASGAVVGVVNVLMIICHQLLNTSMTESYVITHFMLAMGGGLLSGFIVLSLLPLVEWAFKYTTDLSLLELSNLDHPALRELFVKASGSYHHSLMVGTLAEAAAEAIGANALLARVGSYFHDIGKSRNPEYFTENQRGRNPHDDLKPAMSAKIIRSHVSDGEKMAREYRLPEIIIDFIKQHHGTRIIGHFFYKAKTEEDPTKSEVQEKDFRYFGPIPQTKEIAICMLADGSEAGTRALKIKTEASIRERVRSIFDDAWKNGQLDASAITKKELTIIFETIVKLLVNIHHQRVEYATNKKKDSDKKNKR